MAMIDFNSNPKFSCLGGGSYLPSLDMWPINPITNAPMLLLMTLDNDFFGFQMLPSDDWAVSVFISVKYDAKAKCFNSAFSNRFTLHEQNEYDDYDCAFTKVILHPKGDKELHHPDIDYPIFNKTYVALREETQEELEEIADYKANDYRVLPETSRVFDNEAWLQDPIECKPDEIFVLQINQFDLDELSPQNTGLFMDGLGYLICKKNLKDITEQQEVGKFFVQYT